MPRLQMRTRAYRDADWMELLRLSQALAPQYAVEEHANDLRSCLARADAAVFVLERPEGGLAGYVEVGTRAYADGCASSPVGYIEAWYVDPDVRRDGHGRSLLAEAEGWARARGYAEMASDALVDNDVSLRAHERSGYEVVDRIVQFRKALAPERRGDSAN